jgi:adenosylcobinamide kinase/adenosylcobinamide-phosphate guanylyltransferase
MSLTLLLGGARSGKSTLAVRRAAASDAPVVFVATGEARDEEMAERIARHQAARPATWQTVEAPAELADALRLAPETSTMIVDCLSLSAASAAAALAAARPGLTLAVSNEVGMGIVPMHPLGRRYRDLLGRVNAVWAEAADEAVLVVAGRQLGLERP